MLNLWMRKLFLTLYKSTPPVAAKDNERMNNLIKFIITSKGLETKIMSVPI